MDQETKDLVNSFLETHKQTLVDRIQAKLKSGSLPADMDTNQKVALCVYSAVMEEGLEIQAKLKAKDTWLSHRKSIMKSLGYV